MSLLFKSQLCCFIVETIIKIQTWNSQLMSCTWIRILQTHLNLVISNGEKTEDPSTSVK